MSLIQISNLNKSYDKLRAVSNFSLEAEKGELLAVAGPDGAGKTTIFRTVCGLLDYDKGTINLDGYDIKNDFDKIKPLLGYMPQNFSLYPDLSVEENLYFYAGLFGLSKEQYERKKERLYQFSGLEPFASRRAGELSGGMKQKLALSCNLIHDPKFLILDEPTTGVDPVSRRQFWDILKRLKEDGSTIVVSTPYMDEVELADRAVFIHNGQKLIEGQPDELLNYFKGVIYNIKAVPSSAIMNQLNQIEGLTSRRFGSTIHLYTTPEQKIEEYYGRLSQLGINTESIIEIKPELEDLFIQLMEHPDA
jgi:ABC-type multidrug transport system ATPase subunit